MKIDKSITPRRWQSEAVEVWAKKFRGVVRVVTGGGKTVFSYLCMEKFFDKYSNGRAIIVVPTLALLDQWLVDICDATDIDESDIACYWGGSHPEQPAKINIIVLNTARQITQEISEPYPTILIVDECHRAGSVENSRALEGVHEATVGLSATPERESDKGFESRIVPVLGSIFYAYDYPEAKSDGVIVDFALINVEIALDDDDISRLPVLSQKRDNLVRGYTDSPELTRIRKAASKKITYSAEYAMRIPWAVKLALHHRDERVIIFHERVASLNKITDLLAKYGQNSVIYHSHLSASHRRDNLRLFRRGMVNMLVTCRALDEGANVPEANVGIIAHSTSSTRQRIQRLGRVLRPASGKDQARIYTLYIGEEQKIRLSEEAAGLEGVAKSIWKKGYLQ